MAGVQEKLYPPIIGASIPAFYEENGTAIIAVPFSMNRAVSRNSIKGFSLKIKTVQSNTLIAILDTDNVDAALLLKTATFKWSPVSSKVSIGQYLKVQMAYISQEDTIGYYSTVATVKYTTKPTVLIPNAETIDGNIPVFKKTYVGTYAPGADYSERPYSYIFQLYDQYGDLVESSGWRLHNTELDLTTDELNNVLSLTESSDSYEYQTVLKDNQSYFIQYGVRSINNLETFSQRYQCIQSFVQMDTNNITLSAENIFEEGYIQLSFHSQSNNLTESELNQKINIALEITRASSLDGFESWQVIKKQYFSNLQQILDWHYNDFVIDQGLTYQYQFRQYNASGLQTESVQSNYVLADFEDMFLWDGKKQVKIRFNPKMSSFKTNRLETKTETLGSRYPFIYRNGVIEYREFPVAGLISYLADNNELFMTAAELGLLSEGEVYRVSTPINQNVNDISDGKSWERRVTMDSVGYNIRAERLFKMRLLEWLGNGKVKLFKSPTEGNFLIRLLNVSLTPEDASGRMLHNFQATAYEVEELTYQNLINLGMVEIESASQTTEIGFETVKFFDDDFELPEDNIQDLYKINKNIIFNQLSLMLTPQTLNNKALNGIYLRSETNSGFDKIFVQPNYFNLTNIGDLLPNIYFSFSDNKALCEDYEESWEDNHALTREEKEEIVSVIKDATLTYQYKRVSEYQGVIQAAEKVYIKNIIKTLIAKDDEYTKLALLDSSVVDEDDETITREEIIQFFSLDFQPKDGNNGACEIYLTDIDDNETEIFQYPIISLKNPNKYKEIEIKGNVVLTCAYRVRRIVAKKEDD